MKCVPALGLMLAGTVSAQITPPPAAQTPSGLIYSLAVHRGWTEQTTPFCDARTSGNRRASYPNAPKARFKFVRTFQFTSTSGPNDERVNLGWMNTGLDSNFPWQVGQWTSRQYSSAMTPQYLYLLEMQEVPGRFSSSSNICMTVFSLR